MGGERPRKRSRSGHGDAGGGAGGAAAAGAGTRGRGRGAAPAGGECEYKRRCREFLDSLKLDSVYFNAEHDRCYCPVCAAAVSMPDVLERDKAHGCPYEVPKGWCGFGLEVPKRAFSKELAVFEKWAVSFHGCPSGNVGRILQEGMLMRPGDTLHDGRALGNRATVGSHDRMGVYTSPSIKYAELNIYAQPRKWRGGDGRQHTVRTVMQCRQNMAIKWPELRVEGETIGWQQRFGEAQFSQHFTNDEIERFTKATNSVIPYRVLVGLDVKTREEELEGLKAVAMAATKAAEDVAKAADDAAAAANAAWAALEAATGSPVPPADKARGGFLERLRGWAGLVPQAMVCGPICLGLSVDALLLASLPSVWSLLFGLLVQAVSAAFCVAVLQPVFACRSLTPGFRQHTHTNTSARARTHTHTHDWSAR